VQQEPQYRVVGEGVQPRSASCSLRRRCALCRGEGEDVVDVDVARDVLPDRVLDNQ